MRAAPRIAMSLGALLMASAAAVAARMPLESFSGVWTGQGTDRDSPMQSLQKTRCRNTVKADATHMNSHTECTGEAGLNKRFDLSITFKGDRFTGKLDYVSTERGGAPQRYAGEVTGSRTDEVADFIVRFSGLTPNAHVVLRLTSATSYAMVVSVLGSTLTDVKFHRPPPGQ
jgi:hypothetical protein